MTSQYKRTVLSLVSLAALLILAVGSVDSKSSADRPSGSIPDGNRAIADAYKGTTLQKDRHKEANKGKTFNFEGEVEDVTDTYKVKIELDSGNYANVDFKEAVDKLEKGSQIKFRATIEEFGTGILINHKLINAELKK